MPKTLLVDTNRAAYPIYQALVNWGHDVWVVGGRADEPLAGICPNYCQLDYSSLDQLDTFIKKHGFDYIVPGCTDLSYGVCSEMGGGKLPGIDPPKITRAINEKSEFRKLAGSLALSVPKVIESSENIATDSVIVKPVDSFSGRGISILRDFSKGQLDEALVKANSASRTGTCLVEEFVTGQLYSHSAFLRSSDIVADFIVREDCIANPFTVDTSKVVLDFPPHILSRIRDEISRLARHLNLVDGLIHTQFVSSGNSHHIIEITRRCPGDLYALMIEMATGYPYGAAYAAPFVGRHAPAWNEIERRFRRIIRHTATSAKGEIFWGLRFSQKIRLPLLLSLAKTGEFIKESPFGRAALFFLEADSEEEMDLLYDGLLSRSLYEMQ